MSIGVSYLVLTFQERYIKIKRFLKYPLIPVNARTAQSSWLKNTEMNLAISILKIKHCWNKFLCFHVLVIISVIISVIIISRSI